MWGASISVFLVMLFQFKDQFPQLNVFWDKYLPYQERREVPAKTVLLEEGKIAGYYIFIEKGAVLASFNNNGEDKAVQFFFENEGLTSFESFINETPGQFTIRTIEPSVLYLLPAKHVAALLTELSAEAAILQFMVKVIAKRQTHYINEFVSIIRDTPEERYRKILVERPHIIQRVPQHYIASYLGVSAVHLSRIRNKLLKGRQHF